MAQLGIKDTLELIDGLAKFIEVIQKHLQDGFQLQDLLEISYEVTSKQHPEICAAIEGIENVIPELKDLSVFEKFQLVQKLIAFVKLIQEQK